jgi:hypothetical protein
MRDIIELWNQFKTILFVYLIMFAAGSNPISYIKFPILYLKAWKWKREGKY